MSPAIIALLLNLGGTLGASFIKSPQLQATIAAALTGAESLITILTNKGSANVAAPVFMTALEAAIAILEATGKLDAKTATALNDAIKATLAADAAGQVLVDPDTLTPIAPLP
jgi:hypothetical protein